LLSDFCKKYESYLDDEKSRKMFSVKTESTISYNETTYRAMSFVIQSGSYGVEADMTNRHGRL